MSTNCHPVTLRKTVEIICKTSDSKSWKARHSTFRPEREQHSIVHSCCSERKQSGETAILKPFDMVSERHRAGRFRSRSSQPEIQALSRIDDNNNSSSSSSSSKGSSPGELISSWRDLGVSEHAPPEALRITLWYACCIHSG